MNRPRARAVSGCTGAGQHRPPHPTLSVSASVPGGIPDGRATMERLCQIGVLCPTDAPTEATRWLTR